jgi:hypothetical protein
LHISLLNSYFTLALSLGVLASSGAGAYFLLEFVLVATAKRNIHTSCFVSDPHCLLLLFLYIKLPWSLAGWVGQGVTRGFEHIGDLGGMGWGCA